MAIVTTDDSHYKAIADTLREYNGGSGKFKPSEMANEMAATMQTRYLDGWDDGYSEGWDHGERNEYNRFWDNYQDNGNRTNYTNAFGGAAWSDETYNPKYPITANGGAYLFWNTNITDTKVDIHLGYSTGSMGSRFNSAKQLVTIRKLIVEDERVTFGSNFNGCTALENITIEGVIGQPFDISPATKLTHDSLISIINHLKDLTESGTTQTLTIGSTNIAKLTQEEISVAENKGWMVK